jgi:SNF2 family DNA or RNA helicase
MPQCILQCAEIDGGLEVSGSALAVQSLRAELTRALGPSAVLTSGGRTFRIGGNVLMAAADILVEHGLHHDLIDAALAHRAKLATARQVALERAAIGTGATLPDYWRAILEPKQAAAVEAMTVENLAGLCLFDEQGSGKTVMIVAAVDILFSTSRTDFALIACPKSMCGEWLASIQKFPERKYVASVVEGTRHERNKQILAHCDILITNFEQLSAHETALRAACESRNTVFVADESFYLKNPDARRSDSALRLRSNCRIGYVACGTPAPNAPLDLVHQFNLADGGVAFAGYKPTGDPTLDGPAIESIIERRGVFIRRLKEEILAFVPTKKFHVHSVQLTGRQLEMYTKAEKDLLVELRTFDNKVFKKRLLYYLQQREMLLRICACPDSVDPLFDGANAKLEMLEHLSEELLRDQQRKIVVWSFYTAGVDAAERLLKKYGVVRIDGAVTDRSQRDAAVRAFQEDPAIRVFVGNPAAAGAGITLHAAADAIYLSYSKQAAHHLQSIDRIHRRGQKSDQTTYHLIVCEDTVEENELRRLRNKELQQADLLGDASKWPADLDQAIAELVRQ